jgi:DNA (cytosine-5)-methyltransferase 1
VLSDLEAEGYEVQCFLVPACGVDAPHKRERVAILAYSIDRGGSVRRYWQLQDSAKDGRTWSDNRRGEAAAITGERWQDESRAPGMADGLRTAVHEADSDSDLN